jgi:hypothetical protein
VNPYGQAPQRPPKYRPSAGWLVLGLGMFLTSVAVGIGVFVWLLVGLLDFDTIVEADGTTNLVTVGTDRDRMLWMDSTAQTCEVVDHRTGEQIPLRPVDESYTRADSNGDFEGLLRFDPGSGRIELTCTQTDGRAQGEVMVSAVPRLENAVAGIVVASITGLFGLIGILVILWTGTLWSLRQPRPRGY